MRGNRRTVTVRLIEKEYINNARLVEHLADKYMKGRINNEQ